MPFTNVKRCKQIANSLLLFMSSTVEKKTVFGREVHRAIFCLCSPRSPQPRFCHRNRASRSLQQGSSPLV